MSVLPAALPVLLLQEALPGLLLQEALLVLAPLDALLVLLLQVLHCRPEVRRLPGSLTCVSRQRMER